MEDAEMEIRRLAGQLHAARERANALRKMQADQLVAEERAIADAECMRLNVLLARAQGRYAEGR